MFYRRTFTSIIVIAIFISSSTACAQHELTNGKDTNKNQSLKNDSTENSNNDNQQLIDRNQSFTTHHKKSKNTNPTLTAEVGDAPDLMKSLVVTPASNDINVVTSIPISAMFERPDKHPNLVVESIQVFNGNKKVDGVIFLKKNVAEFLPLQPLLYNTNYTAKIAAINFDKHGETVQIQYKWDFKTINPKADWIVFFNDLNTQNPHIYTIEDLRKNWNYRGKGAGIKEGRATVVSGDFPNQGNILKIRYEAKKHGLEAGGVQWRTRLRGHDELYLSYNIKFADNFDFVRGGKIPGLVGGRTKPGKKPTGNDFFIGRMTFGGGGKILQYVYHLHQRNPHGDGFPWDLGGPHYFIPGKWHHVENRIRLNTPGIANGIIQSWFDGELAFEKNDFEFRTENTLKIDLLSFSTFFGGGDTTWASSKEENAYFDNVVVSTKSIMRSTN